MVDFAVKTAPHHTEWSDMLEVWREADDIDVFAEAWNFDHFYPLSEPTDGPCFEAWTTLAALAQATKRIRVGCMVAGMHYRHPAVTANMAASLDIISEGRLNLGLGAGWYELESKAYGIELGTIRERMDRFDEGVAVIKSLLSNETTSFDGKFFKLEGARCEPKPVQRPTPPIVIGGRGEKRTLRTVAMHGDYWDALFTPVAEWQRLDGVLRDHCAAVGRDQSEIRRSIHVRWHPDADPKELADTALEYAEAGVDVVIFGMQHPYRASRLAPLAEALRA